VRRLEEGGSAAVVLHSLFEEQLTQMTTGRIRQMDVEAPEFAEAISQFPNFADYPLHPYDYAEHIRRVKNAVGIPVIGSLNGGSAESWLRFAEIIEQAGADGLELNLYELVTDLKMPSAAVEQSVVDVVRELKRVLRIPIAVKLTPFFTAFANIAHRLDEAGADALVLFNPAVFCGSRTVSTGQGAMRPTCSATLPSNRCATPRRPCVPSTIRSML
jgi:dihydroorotate dehydrogenase (fumarate)